MSTGVGGVDLLETVGAVPREQIATTVHIVAIDNFSPDDPTVLPYALRPNLDGSPVYSMERWMRLRFNQPFGSVRAFRFWIDTFVMPYGWHVAWGVSSIYQIPSNAPSVIATNTLFEYHDPGEAHPNVGDAVRLYGTQTQYTPWIVLQTHVTGDAIEHVVPTFNYHFAWREA